MDSRPPLASRQVADPTLPKTVRMTNQSHRYLIWTYAPPPGQNVFDVPAVPTRRDPLLVEKRRYSEIFSPPTAASGEPAASSNGGSSSLYHYGLPVEIGLPGLCTLPNGRSSAFLTEKISSDFISFIYDESTPGYRFKLPDELPLGTRMHLDLDRIGEFHGSLASQNLRGFKIAVAGECKTMLGGRLALLAAAMRTADLEEPSVSRTTITRVEPQIKNCRFTDHSGASRKGWIINVSPVDALIKAAVVPPVGSPVVFAGHGRYEAEVTRAFEIGFAVNFREEIPESEFSPAIKFLDE